MNHWTECINIWRVTSFGHRLIKEYIWQKPGERYRPIAPLVYVIIFTKLIHVQHTCCLFVNIPIVFTCIIILITDNISNLYRKRLPSVTSHHNVPLSMW